MKRLQALALVAPLLVSAGCDRASAEGRRARAGDSVTINRSWPAADLKTIAVSEIDGNITVEASEQIADITLVATARGDVELQEDHPNRGVFETEIKGDTLQIGRKEKRGDGLRIPILFFEDDVEIDYTLKIPARMALDVTTVNGRIHARGMDGQTDASTVNGRIEVETTGSHELTASTVNGKVRAKFLRDFHGARFKTVNGSVLAALPPSASFSVDLSQVNGDFEASFPVSIHSHPGSRRVSGDVNGGEHDLKIVTVNGDVELERINGQH
jgi:DUF4097 and DUF4098 domain-containing protein YvlB